MEVPNILLNLWKLILLKDGKQYIIDNNLLLLSENNRDRCVYVPINQVQDYTALEGTENTADKNYVLSEINDKNSFAWNDKTILLMLEEYKKRAERFRNPKAKKKQVWQEISDEMAKYGYTIDADAIDKKFRNMKSRYLIIKDNNDKKKTTGAGRISWPYFDIMSEIFVDDRTVNPNLVIASTILSNNNNNNVSKETATFEKSNTSNNSSDQENESISSPASSSSNNSSICRKSMLKKFRKRNRSVDLYRKRNIEIEEERNMELKMIRQSIEENNTIQKQKLEVLRQALNKEGKL